MGAQSFGVNIFSQKISQSKLSRKRAYDEKISVNIVEGKANPRAAGPNDFLAGEPKF